MGRWSYRRCLWALAVVVALLAIVIYLPALGNDFTNWDDRGYVAKNSHLGPLDANFLAWAFTTYQQGNWHPLTWLSLGVDRALFGLAPWGYHLSNVFLHGVAVLLVALLVGELFARARGVADGRGLAATAVVGLLFAVHPLHVESVAWVSERKDVLCGVFYILAILSYLSFTKHGRRVHYLASLGAFALAILAKPMAVSLPLVLLILDAYPLGRMTRDGCLRVVAEKTPFVAITVASALVTIMAQWRAGAVAGMHGLGLGSRLWGAERALGFYLAKMALPMDLSPVYPRGNPFSPWRWDFLVSLVLVVGLSAAVIVLRRRAPLLGALWATYLVMLAPVIGIVQVGEQAAADRYMYLPLLVPAIGVGAVVVRVWKGGRPTRTVLSIIALAALAALSISTVRQIGVWRDTLTLWAWVIEKQPGAAIAHYNLGEYLREKGELGRAGQCWRRAAELEPTFAWPLNELGNLAEQRGAFDEARSYFEQAIRVSPRYAEARYNYAAFLDEQGQPAEARVHYEIFLRVAPANLAYLFPEVRARLSELAQP